MGKQNLLLTTDSYKVSHHVQYPPGTTHIYSYLESRGGTFPTTVFFGLQYILKKYFEGVVVTAANIDEAEEMYNLHFGKNLFNRKGWEHILNEHGGILPLSICAVPEGSVVPWLTPLVTVENTDPAVPWLTNWFETILSHMWYPITVATQSYYAKDIITQWLERTGTPAEIDMKLHDFGFRGVSSIETAGIGGAAHLVNFMGTDNIAALKLLRKYYDCEMAAFSIPASEHSTITAWGRENEVDAFRNMLKQYPIGLAACVSDSYDIYNACEHLWGEILRDEVLARDGTLIIRPDSGNPCEVVPRCLEILGNKFGYTVNEKGYKVLNPKVRMIQGDGINLDMINTLLSTMEEAQWSADNIAFGSGGALLQMMNRDTNKFAFKASSAIINGIKVPVYKDPITSSNKKSKTGRFDLPEVFRNGVMVKEFTLDEIREKVNETLLV